MPLGMDAGEGVAHRIVARWTSDTERSGPREVQLELAARTTDVAADWYNHAAHHAPDRRIIRREGGDASAVEF